MDQEQIAELIRERFAWLESEYPSAFASTLADVSAALDADVQREIANAYVAGRHAEHLGLPWEYTV